MTRGTVVAPRIAWNRRVPTDVIVHVENTHDPEAARRLIGKRVTWQRPGADEALRGYVIGIVGKDGRVLARFPKPFPEDAVPSAVEVA